MLFNYFNLFDQLKDQYNSQNFPDILDFLSYEKGSHIVLLRVNHEQCHPRFFHWSKTLSSRYFHYQSTIVAVFYFDSFTLNI